jgi:hypothetical protein
MILKRKSLVLVIISSLIITIVIISTFIGHFLYMEMKNMETDRKLATTPAGR